MIQLYINGKIHTFGPAGKVDWLLCAAGNILALGLEDSRPQNLTGPAHTIDLHKATVIPAFTDAHTHFVTTALKAIQIDLDETDSLSAALRKIKSFQNSFKPGQWVRGGGYNKNVWQDGQPHKKYLDKIFPNNPVALESKDFHAIWVNSKALEIAGINNNTTDPAGGRIIRDKNKETSGLLYEKAVNLIYEKASLPADQVITESVQLLAKQMHAVGITTVHTMEGLGEFQALQKMAIEDTLEIRTRFYIPKKEGRKLIDANIRSGFGNANISIAGIKFFTDGSLGSQTAHMLEPYPGTTGKGISHISERALAEEILFYNMNGLNAAVHAIGDQAIIKTLNAFEFAQSKQKHDKLRNRIEHAQLVPLDQMQRIAGLNLAASMQPVHIADDVEIAERYWGQRCVQAYPIAQLQNAGVTLAFGSDTPVADYNPFKGVYEALERKYMFDPEQPSWYPQQAILLKDALKAYTMGPAIACGDEKHCGSLEPGKYADFIVLDRDIFNVASQQLLDTKVMKTILNGKVIFSRSSEEKY